MEYQDERLPAGVSVWLNDFSEYVAIEFGEVAQIGRKNVRAGRSLDEAVKYYLSGEVAL